MERRVALRNIALVAGSLISFPSWANSWNKQAVESTHSYLSSSQDALLAELVETIIPATTTPGAKALGVHSFIQTMVADCFEKNDQHILTKGLETVEATAKQRFGKSFVACDTTQRTEILQSMEKSTEDDQKKFYSLVKDLTIRGYMSSEYVMTNISHFEFVPARFHGCVPVPTK
ncbi:MAG: gluconate 2-dehydrogenase subunit 3 family protein [Bacteroidota bacterium]